MKTSWKPGTMIAPVAAALVSCGSEELGTNLFTASWVGTICTTPPMCYVSIRPERYSYRLIKETGEFVLNLTTTHLARETDWCGVRSGRNFDKWKETGLTPTDCVVVSCPQVQESPVSIECKVRQILPLGSHDMFIAEVVNVWVDDRYINKESGKLDLQAAGLMTYAHGEYFAPGDFVGYFGWSVKKGNDPIERRK